MYTTYNMHSPQKNPLAYVFDKVFFVYVLHKHIKAFALHFSILLTNFAFCSDHSRSLRFTFHTLDSNFINKIHVLDQSIKNEIYSNQL
jgi:hypothetical protein